MPQDRHDPLAAPVDTDAVDLDIDSDEGGDSAGVDLQSHVEREDGERVPNPAAAAAPTESSARASKSAGATARQQAGDDPDPDEAARPEADDDDEDDRVASGLQPRDDAGKFRPRASEAQPPTRRDKSYERGERRAQRLRDQLNGLTRQIREAEERIARGSTASKTEKPSEKTKSQQALEALGAKPKWSDYQTAGKDFDTWEHDKDEWLKKSTRLELQVEQEQRDLASRADADTRQRAEQQAAGQRKWAERLEAVREKHDDFDELLEEAEDVEIHKIIGLAAQRHEKAGGELFYQCLKPENADLVEDVGDFLESLPEEDTFPLMLACEESTDPARLMFALADPAIQKEVRKALRLAPRSATAALIRLDERLAGSVHGSHRKPQPKRADPLISHRAGSRTVSAARSAPAQQSTDDYVKARRAGKSPEEALRS